MLFWCGENDCCRRTVAKPVILAQASQSRLGEMNRDSPGSFLRERSSRRPARLLSEQATRPGERDLAKARSRVAHAPVLVPSPRRRGNLPERDCLAWTRPLSLSEVLGKTVLWLDVCWFLNDLFLVEYDCMMSDMYIMEHEVYLAWFMNCRWWVGMRIGMWIKWDG